VKLSLRKSPTLQIGPAAITIRPCFGDDHSSLRVLAALDSAEIPPSPVLLAEVDGQLRAALSLQDGSVIADPFFPTVHLVELLKTRAAASAPAPSRRRTFRLSYA
jgi:hypothetical protein